MPPTTDYSITNFSLRELDKARELHSLLELLEDALRAVPSIREDAFRKWTGPIREEAWSYAVEMEYKAGTMLEKVKNARDTCVAVWIDAVDYRNTRVYEEELENLAIYMDRIVATARDGFLEEVGGWGQDVIDWGTNYRGDNPKDLVDRPKSIKEDPWLWPRAPLFLVYDVFLHYESDLGKWPPRSYGYYGDKSLRGPSGIPL